MGRNAFYDPITGILKCHGFVESNNLGDVKQAVAEDFALEPGKWRWDGTAWVSFTPPPLPPSSLAQALDTAINATPSIDPRVKAVFVEWRKVTI